MPHLSPAEACVEVSLSVSAFFHARFQGERPVKLTGTRIPEMSVSPDRT